MIGSGYTLILLTNPFKSTHPRAGGMGKTEQPSLRKVIQQLKVVHWMHQITHQIHLLVYHVYLVGGIPTPLKNDGVRNRLG